MQKTWKIILIANAIAVAVTTADQTVEMPDFVVTPTRTPVAITDVPAAATLLPATTLGLHGPLTVDGALRTLPGLEIQSSGAPADNIKINMRGLTSGFQTKRVLVLQDGRRINEQYQGNAEFMTLPVTHIDRIEVVRGPGSALYGSGAMGGVMQIFSRQGSSPPETALSTSYGTFNTRQANLRHGNARHTFDYAFASGWMETDGWLERPDGTTLNWRNAHFDVNAGWQPNADTDIRFFTGAYQGEGNEFNNARKARKDYQMLVWNQATPSAKDGQLTVRIYRNGQRDRYDWLYPGEGHYNQNTLAAELIHGIWVNPQHRITLGGEVRQDSVDVEEVTATVDESNLVMAMFAQDEWFVHDKLRLQVGLRVDRDMDYDTTFSPRVAALYKTSSQAELYASYNRAHRAPALSDRFASAVFFNMLFIGNPDLTPETLDAFEVGLRYRPNQRIQTAIALFWNEMRDSFEAVYVPERNALRPENISNTRTYGAELEARIKLGDPVSLFASYTFTEGEYTSDPRPAVEGKRVTYLAKHKANGGLSLDAGRAGTHEAVVVFAGDRYTDITNETKLDAYTLAHWSSRLAIAPHTWLRLNINNITDTSYRHFAPYEQPGRSIMGTLEWIF
ncbi:MAG: TonB-dependent receptor plug domain-containing protein [Kiritimatiellia bacterium]